MTNSEQFDPRSIERPDPALLRYYILSSLIAGPLFPIAFLPLYFRYITLRYKFDDSGVSMRWGILFRREVYLTYKRVQDIHLTRNILQRWMGLAKISLQTASGSSQAEMTIEGFLEAEELRDFLYSQMRGAKNPNPATLNSPSEFGEPSNSSIAERTNDSYSASVSGDRAIMALQEIRDALQLLVTQKTSSESLGSHNQSNGGNQ